MRRHQIKILGFLSILLLSNCGQTPDQKQTIKTTKKASNIDYTNPQTGGQLVTAAVETTIEKKLDVPKVPISISCSIQGGNPASLRTDPYGNALKPSTTVQVSVAVTAGAGKHKIGLLTSDPKVALAGSISSSTAGLIVPLAFGSPGNQVLRFFAKNSTNFAYCDLFVTVDATIPTELLKTIHQIYSDRNGDGRDFFLTDNETEKNNAMNQLGDLRYYEPAFKLFSEPVGACNIPIDRLYNGKAHAVHTGPVAGFNKEWTLGYACPAETPTIKPILRYIQNKYTFVTVDPAEGQNSVTTFGWTPTGVLSFAMP